MPLPLFMLDIIQDLFDEVTRDSPLSSSFATTLSPTTSSPHTRKSPRIRRLCYHDDVCKPHPTTPTQPFRAVKRRPPESKTTPPQVDLPSKKLLVSVPLENVAVERGQATPTGGGHMTNHVITLPKGLVTSQRESEFLQQVLQPLTCTLSREGMQELVESITPDMVQTLLQHQPSTGEEIVP